MVFVVLVVIVVVAVVVVEGVVVVVVVVVGCCCGCCGGCCRCGCLCGCRCCVLSRGRTAKSGPNVVYFSHFDFEMCFVPQRRALFHHLNVQKWLEHVVFWTF